MNDSWRILTEPTTFCEEHIGREFRFKPALAIFGGYLLLTLIAQSVFYMKTRPLLPFHNMPDLQKIVDLTFVVTCVAIIIGGLTFWFIGAGILTCLSILMDGLGEYRKLVELTGYAQLPALFVSVIVMGLMLVYTPNLDFGGNVAVSQKDPKTADAAMEQAVRRAFELEAQSTKFVVLRILNQCAMVWSVVLCAIALKYTNRLNWVKTVTAFILFLGFYGLLEIAKRRLDLMMKMT